MAADVYGWFFDELCAFPQSITTSILTGVLIMDSRDIEIEANLDYWDALAWVFSLGLCQLQERGTGHFSEGLDHNQIFCDNCYDAGMDLVRGPLRELLNAFGTVVYECGRQGTPYRSAQRRALRSVLGMSAQLAYTSEGARNFLQDVDDHAYSEAR